MLKYIAKAIFVPHTHSTVCIILSMHKVSIWDSSSEYLCCFLFCGWVETPWPKATYRRECILAYGSRESVMTGYPLSAQEAEEKQEVGKVANPQSLPCDGLPSFIRVPLEFYNILQIALQLETKSSITWAYVGTFLFQTMPHVNQLSFFFFFLFWMAANIPCTVSSIGAVLRRISASILCW